MTRLISPIDLRRLINEVPLPDLLHPFKSKASALGSAVGEYTSSMTFNECIALDGSSSNNNSHASVSRCCKTISKANDIAFSFSPSALAERKDDCKIKYCEW